VDDSTEKKDQEYVIERLQDALYRLAQLQQMHVVCPYERPYEHSRLAI
jgi:hypothetical protein